MSKIGMMDPAFFVDRNTLLNWLNDLLGLGYTKVEQCASGAAHCQIMDAIYQGKVPLHKVNFDAKFEYEWVKNYKVLQNVFDKNGIEKHIDVQKLIKGKYQDNLEFLQWIKRYYDMHYPGARPAGGAPKAAAAPRAAAGRQAPAGGGVRGGAGSQAPAATGGAAKPRRAPIASRSTGAPAPAADDGEIQAELDAVRGELADMKITLSNLEKERDFYFEKLRDVEVACQQEEDVAEGEKAVFLKSILDILYKAEDNGEEEA